MYFFIRPKVSCESDQIPNIIILIFVYYRK